MIGGHGAALRSAIARGRSGARPLGDRERWALCRADIFHPSRREFWRDFIRASTPGANLCPAQVFNLRKLFDMSALPNCPRCNSPHTYGDGALFVCPECAHEWSADATASAEEEDGPRVVKDAVGNVLADGDSVTVVKDLKIKGSSSVVKIGTKVRNIRLINGTGGHDIDCKIDGIGPMQLKSEFVKKA